MQRAAARRTHSQAGRPAARYDMGPVRGGFGYGPQVPIDEGLARLRAAYQTDAAHVPHPGQHAPG